MSKATENRAFRTVDVDLYNEDNYKEEADTEVSTEALDFNQLNSLLNSNKNVEALKLFLAGSPVGIKDPDTKSKVRDLAQRILLAVKKEEMEAVVSKMDKDTLDVLMKFIYAGFERPVEGSSGHLLVWHDKVFSASGVGSVVRVLSDKRKA